LKEPKKKASREREVIVGPTNLTKEEILFKGGRRGEAGRGSKGSGEKERGGRFTKLRRGF